MALQLTVGSTDRTSALLNESVSVEHTALNHISVCSFTLYDATASISIAEEDAVYLIDGVTPYFVGRVVSVSYTPKVTAGRNIFVQAQDLNAIITETIVDVPLEFLAESDYDIINYLFDAYLPVVDSETHVAVIQDPLTIRFEPTTLASCLNQICTQSGGYWYVDFSNRLHYFIDENVPAAFGLSDTPNGSTTFSYLDKPECDIDAITRLDGVYVAGAGVEGWVGTHAPGDRTAIVWDNRITTNDGILERGNAILGKHGAPKLLYRVWTRQPGLVAGQKVHFKCGIYDVDDDLSIRRVKITWGADRQPVFQLELGDPFNPALAQQAWYDVVEQAVGPVPAPLLPLSSRGWSHDLVFSATDNDTVAWAAGTLTTAGGSSFSLDAGNTGNMAATTYVFLDTDTSDTVLQTTTSVTVAVGANKIMIAVCEPQAAGLDATFFVFGSSVQGVLVDTPNILPGSITTPTLADGAVTHTKTVLGLQNWGHTLVFSATDNNTVAWEAGIITTGDGSTFNIDAGNTGNIAARTYIYLNTDVSSTVLQTTTTAATATGNNKVLIAVASPQAADYNATFIVYGSELQSTLVDTANITAGAVTAAKAATALLDWSNTLVFTATTYRQVGWAAGTIVLSNGTTYNIVAGNTGNMTAATRYHVYLDIATSTTVLQVTTTAANAVGTNKILVAVCYPSTSPKLATYQVMGGGSTGVLITADNVVANTLTTNEIAANTITAANIAAGTITGTEIAAATITGAKIAALTIEAGNIAANAITATKIAAATITGDKIAANTITGGNIGANTITADKFLGVGDFVFTQDSGLLLLGPGNECVPTKWVSTRGQVATLSGAFHQVAGPWAQSRALVVEPAATNLFPNPSLETGTASWNPRGSATTLTRVTTEAFAGTYSLQVVTLTGGTNNGVACDTFVTASQTYTLTVRFKGIAGQTYRVGLNERTPERVSVGTTEKSVIATGGWQTVVLTRTFGATGVRARGLIDTLTAAGTFYADAWQLEQTAYATSYVDGDAGTGYSWTGTPYANTSTRAATVVNLDAHASQLSDLDTVTHSVWVQAPYDANSAQWERAAGYSALLDYRVLTTTERVFLQYEGRDSGYLRNLRLYVNGAYRISVSGLAFKAGDWLHLVVTLDYASGVCSLYLNGTRIGSAAAALGAQAGVTHWKLGANSHLDANYHGNWAFGEYAVFSRILSAEEVASLYARSAPLADAGALKKGGLYILDGEFALASSNGGSRVQIDVNGVSGYSAATTQTFSLQTDGDLFMGSNISAPATTGFSFFATAQTYGTASESMGAGDVLLGDNSAGKINLLWDVSEGDVILRRGTSARITLDGSADSILIGQVAASQNNILISSGAISIRNNNVERIGVTAAGILTIKDSSGNAVFTFNASAGAEFTLPLTLATTGGIYQGTGTFASPTTGLKIWNDSGVGRIAGYNTGVAQWYVDTSGIFNVGGGRMTLKATGMWATNASTADAFALSLADGNSWGGWTLDTGDFSIGRSTGGYLRWDDSASTMYLKGSIVITGGSGIGSLSDAGDLATADDLDDVADGSTYKRLYATDISSGHIKLTTYTVIDGDWYDESGVDINASTGITIYGSDSAFTTRATKTGTIECKVDSAGAIVAGAGAVKLDSTGIKLSSGTLATNTLKWYDGTTMTGYINVSGAGESFTGLDIQVNDNVYYRTGWINLLANSEESTSRKAQLYLSAGASPSVQINTGSTIAAGFTSSLVTIGTALRINGQTDMYADLCMHDKDIYNVDKLSFNVVYTSHPSAPSTGIMLYSGVIGGVNGLFAQWGDGHTQLVVAHT